MKKKFNRTSLLIILFLGLTPLLWFRDRFVILGHDSGLTLLPLPHFLDRLYAWTDRFSFGVDQTFAIPGFFIHGLEALISFVGFNLQQTQQISFIFWFVLPGLTMYYLARKLEKHFLISYFALPASVLFMFNHFLLQGWFIAERTKFSLYAALPLIFAFLFDWTLHKRSTRKTALFISLTFLFLNGEASIPLFGGIILFFITFIFTYLYRSFSRKKVISLLKLGLYTSLFSVLFQSYWLIPFGFYVVHNYSKEVAQAGGLNGILGWVNYISENSSLINLFRLQGIPEWYQNPLHPYAQTILTNPFFIFTSFLFPFFSFLSFILIKNKKQFKLIIFFGILALISMVFMAGSHEPFGAFYIFMIKFVPGFISFRTPFYKFASTLWFSYAILSAFSVYFITTFLHKKNKYIGWLFYVVFFAVTFIYNYPFFNGVFFNYMVGERTMRVSVPHYVFDFGNWSASPQRINIKTLSLPQPSPGFRVDAYNWGYWSLAPVTTLLTNAPIITTTGYGSQNANDLLDSLYTLMAQNDPRWKPLARMLGIQSFLLKKDFAWNLNQSITTNPILYEKALHDTDLHVVKKFGEWEVYDFKTVSNKNDITLTNSLNYFVGDTKNFQDILPTQANSKQNQYIFVNEQTKLDKTIDNKINNSYVVPICVNCNLQYNFSDIVLTTPLINRSSKLYSLVALQEKLETRRLHDDSYDSLHYYLLKTLDDSLSFNKLVSQMKSNSSLQNTIADYNKHLAFFNESYEKQKDRLTNDKLMEIDNILRKEILLFDLKLNGSDTLLQSNLITLKNTIKSTKDKVDAITWETIDEHNKKFLIYIPKDDKYFIQYIKDDVDISPYNNSLLLDGKSIDLGSDNNQNLTSASSISLTKGIHKLLSKEDSFNRVNDGERTHTLTQKNECFITNSIKSDPNAIYRITFDYHTLIKSGELGIRYLTTPKTKIMEKDTIQVTSNWQPYLRDYSGANNQTEFRIQFCNNGNLADKDAMEVKNIAVSKITIPKVILSTNHESITSLVGLQYSKINSTNYNLPGQNIAKDTVLSLNETYSPNWTNNLGSSHFEINGYANAWIMSDAKSKDTITINYQIQKLVQVGFLITILSLIATSGWIIVTMRKKNK